MKTDNTNSFENIVRDKINNLDLPYDNADWPRLEKDIADIYPKSNISSIKIASIVSAIIIIAAAFYFINTNSTTQEKNTITETKIIESNNTKAITESTPAKQITSNNINQNNNHKAVPVKVKTQQQVIETNATLSAEETKTEKITETETVQKPENLVKSSDKILPAPNSEFSASKIQLCSGQEVILTPFEISDSINYIWNFGDGTTSEKLVAKHVYLIDGEFTVSLSTEYKNSKKSSNYTLDDAIIVYPSPNADFTISKEINTYSFIPVSAAENIIWKLNNNKISDEVSAEHKFIKTGIYQISCLAENNYGCIDSESKELDVTIEHYIPMPNAFSPDGDGLNDVFGPPTEYCNDYSISFKIFEKSGILLFETNNINNKWDGRSQNSNVALESGIYVWILVTKDQYGNTQTKKGTVNLIR